MDIAGLAPLGLSVRGAFHPEPEDNVPPLPDGATARTVALAGPVGGALWSPFQAGRRDEPDPLDGWTRRVLGKVAADLGAHVVFPFGGPPHLPFQRWAIKAEGLRRSPLGLLIHPRHGLWHSYRGALLFAEALPVPPPPTPNHPCDGCPARPCLKSCPVDAYTTGGFDGAACMRHLRTPAGQACIASGCRSRDACPTGNRSRYAPDQITFHMQAFIALWQN